MIGTNLSREHGVPELTFPTVQFGPGETPWDLRVLLYEGASGANSRNVHSRIARGDFGEPLYSRLDLVQAIHNEINGRLVGGGSWTTAENQVTVIRQFFTWAETSREKLDHEHIESTYLSWADHLIQRMRTGRGLNERSAYHKGAVFGALLDEILERQTPLMQRTNLRMPSRRKTAQGVRAEKQNLEATFAFGRLLQELCDDLTLEQVLSGPLPIRVALRRGEELVFWSGADSRWSVEALTKHESEGTLATRSPLANLRIECELLMFIGQTGMNVSQAEHLPLRAFFYASHLDGYQVKDRKDRRGGEVLFEIFKEFKPHFERYLEWRRQLFPASPDLFPFVIAADGRSREESHQYILRRICRQLGIDFIPPRMLRNTRVNWLLRKSGDVSLSAEMAQHSQETLLKVYERPSQQRAIGELMRFWSSSDPGLVEGRSVVSGFCNGKPEPQPSTPGSSAKPDCIRPTGCLWCRNHRDVDDADYVWSLVSFRHLKTIELSKATGIEKAVETHPAEHAIKRISEKLRWFRESNDVRRAWVDEAFTRIEEGAHHPSWQGLIVQLEA